MPTNYARYLVGGQRTVRANRELGFALAFVAGAINAGGFLAVGQYTSHVTGVVSSMADNLTVGRVDLVVDGVIGVLAFLVGAIACAVMVAYAQHRQFASAYALPLLLEAALILCFGLLGPRLADWQGLLVPVTVVLLCFIMGLQNAVVTTISNAVIRTTHMTGIVTDLGVEIGKLLHERGGAPHAQRTDTDVARIAMLSGLLGSFVIGGLCGAFGFQWFGYIFTVPIAVLLAALAVVPVIDDLRR